LKIVLSTRNPNHCLAANLTSPSLTVFLPACFDILDACVAIFSVFYVKISVKMPTASAETLLAPAFIKILPTGALGITAIVLLIILPHLNQEYKTP